jgi:capsular polysaccharide biosynthesis protein
VEPQFLINLGFGAAGAFGMWILNRLSRSVEKIEDSVKDMPLKYVTKDDYRQDILEIKGMLGKIFDRLETKVDK